MEPCLTKEGAGSEAFSLSSTTVSLLSMSWADIVAANGRFSEAVVVVVFGERVGGG